jgi:hypothetical protein
MPGYGDARFRIDGGDGDQNLFATPLILRKVAAPWFDGQVGQRFGEAWLVQVADGPKAGLVLALTPRTLGEIADDIAAGGWKSVVVHGIDFPGYEPARRGPRSIVGGMAALERL